MIVKMIQNLENKMEVQINSLETRIEKMQELFNKDLEEIIIKKKSQSTVNNAMQCNAAKSLQLYPTLCDPIDGSPLGSSIPGILQPRTLEWVAIFFSNA